MKTTDLSKYDNSWYSPGKGIVVRLIWHGINSVFFKSAFPFNFVKIFFLKFFGAQIGRDVTVKPHVNIKYPWRLFAGNHVWIGEGVWIDNLVPVKIGDHVCISQGALLLTGNHDYTKETFDLVTREITLEPGAWIGARSVVCPGVTCKSHAVLTAGSVAVKDLEPYSVYQGNPAVKIRDRVIS
jgi:putative colanic acid biosynthesis acetyltransferase WcaF